MKDLGLLILRATTGALLAGHGAQKLFGAFKGPGLEGTAGMLEGDDPSLRSRLEDELRDLD